MGDNGASRMNLVFDELCRERPRSGGPDVPQNAIDKSLRVIAKAIEKIDMQCISSKRLGPDPYRTAVIGR